MGFVSEARLSDSPYVDTVTRGWTAGHGSVIRPADSHWHLVFTRIDGCTHPLVVGPWSTSGTVPFREGADILWIRFKLGTFMPHLPTRRLRDTEMLLPGATSQRFWLNGAAWQFPDFENADTFVNRLAREGILTMDPVVSAALDDHVPDVAPRTLRHRFLQATGLTQSQIRQMKRAQQAAALLQRGVSILDAVFEAGYYDQPHLTRSLKQFIGYTPVQILRSTE